MRLLICTAGLVAAAFLMGCGPNRPPWWNPTASGEEPTTSVEGGGPGDPQKTCVPKDPALCAEGCAWSLGANSIAGGSFSDIAVDCGDNVIVAGDFTNTVDFGGEELEDAQKYGDSSDLYVAKLGPDGTHQWSKRFGTPSDQLFGGMAVNASGHILIAGTFEGRLDFGAGAIEAADMAIFVTKLDADGDPLYSRAFETPNEWGVGPRAVAVDSTGATWVGGSIGGPTDLGGGVLDTGSGDGLFLMKMDTDGHHLWSRVYPGGSGAIYQMIPDPQGNMWVAGAYQGKLDLGAGPPPASPDLYYDGRFIAKLNASGDVIWNRFFPTTLHDNVGFQMAPDPDGNVVICGSVYGEMDLGGGVLGDAFAGNGRLVIAKYDSTGGHLWSQQHEASVASTGGPVVVDKTGQILMSGALIGTMDFGDELLYGGPSGEYDPFLAELDPSGNIVWARPFSGDGSAFAGGMALDSTGAIVWTGSFSGTADFGQDVLEAPSPSSDDLFIARYPH